MLDTASLDMLNTMCRDILIYLAKHPLTKFSQTALIGIFKPKDNSRLDQALKKLLSHELIAYQSNGNLYWLTPEEPAHSLLCAQFGSSLSEAPRMLFFEDRTGAALI